MPADTRKRVATVRRVGGRVVPWLIALTVVGAFILWSFLQVRADPTYSTDEIAFDQYAATLALHGTNPYTHSMAPAYALYHLSPNAERSALMAPPSLHCRTQHSLSRSTCHFWRWDGRLNSPSASMSSHGPWLCLLFGLLPKEIRPSALVIGSLGTFTGYAVGGVTDALYVPLLLLAAYFWGRSATEKDPSPG